MQLTISYTKTHIRNYLMDKPSIPFLVCSLFPFLDSLMKASFECFYTKVLTVIYSYIWQLPITVEKENIKCDQVGEKLEIFRNTNFKVLYLGPTIEWIASWKLPTIFDSFSLYHEHFYGGIQWRVVESHGGKIICQNWK